MLNKYIRRVFVYTEQVIAVHVGETGQMWNEIDNGQNILNRRQYDSVHDIILYFIFFLVLTLLPRLLQ